MLIYKARGVVDLVVNDNVQILLGVVFRNIGVAEYLVRHCRNEEFASVYGEVVEIAESTLVGAIRGWEVVCGCRSGWWR